MENVYIFFPFGNALTIFQRCHLGTFQIVCNAKSCRLSILVVYSRPEAVEGHFKTERLDFFYSSG